jgi:hypothetical protein
MRTIRIDKIDKEMITPESNPMVLHSAEDYNFDFGGIRYIKTGLRFYFPADIQRFYSSVVPGIVILDAQQSNIDGDLQFVVLCVSMSASIKRMQPFVSVSFCQMNPCPIRFAEYSEEGKRFVFGRRENIENSTGV